MSCAHRTLRILPVSAAILITASCGIGLDYSIPYEPFSEDDVRSLTQNNWVHMVADNIFDMQKMTRPGAGCKRKQNVCGLDAGISASSLLKPREIFFDPNDIFYIFKSGDKSGYDILTSEYPIMRSKAFPDYDLGILPNSLSTFWSAQLKHHSSEALAFDSYAPVEDKVKAELREGRPVLAMVRITTSRRLPVFMPDDHLGIRTFWNMHWIAIIGFRENEGGKGTEWMIRDNGGLFDNLIVIDDPRRANQPPVDHLLKISNRTMKNMFYTGSVAEDLKLYMLEPDLPIFLEDADDDETQSKLRKDFELMKAYNIIVFKKN